MRIVDTNSLGNSAALQTGRAGETQSAKGAAGGSSKSASPAGDTVELSGASDRIAETLRADSAARAQRVQQLAAAVQSGTYQPNSAAISRAMIDEAISGGE